MRETEGFKLPTNVGQAPAPASDELDDELIKKLRGEITIDTSPEIKREDIPEIKADAIAERIKELTEELKKKAKLKPIGINKREVARIKQKEESETDKVERLTAEIRFKAKSNSLLKQNLSHEQVREELRSLRQSALEDENDKNY